MISVESGFRIIMLSYLMSISVLSTNATDPGSAVVTSTITTWEQINKSYEELKTKRETLEELENTEKKVRDIAWFASNADKVRNTLKLIDDIMCMIERFRLIKGRHDRAFGTYNCFWDIKINLVQSSLSSNIMLINSTLLNINNQVNSLDRAGSYSASLASLKKTVNDLEKANNEMETDLEAKEKAVREVDREMARAEMEISMLSGASPSFFK